MARKVERLVVDTNLWISFLINNNFKELDQKIRKGKVRIVFSVELLDEFLTVADRPKFRKYFNKRDLEELISLFDSYGEVVAVYSRVSVCRDPKDNFILALAKDSKANFLLTGDNDLLDLTEFEGTKIMGISDYLKRSS